MKEGESPPLVWRASNDNGDKPGNGIELTLRGGKIHGQFFLLAPEKPHNFEAGHSFPITILERRAEELVCEVTFGSPQAEKFTLKLPKFFPRDRFVAIFQDAEPGTTAIDFVFERTR